MDIIVIIGAVLVASFAGYLFRMAIEKINDAKIGIFQFSMMPSFVKYLLCVAFCFIIMSIAILVVTFEGPF